MCCYYKQKNDTIVTSPTRDSFGNHREGTPEKELKPEGGVSTSTDRSLNLLANNTANVQMKAD